MGPATEATGASDLAGRAMEDNRPLSTCKHGLCPEQSRAGICCPHQHHHQ